MFSDTRRGCMIITPSTKGLRQFIILEDQLIWLVRYYLTKTFFMCFYRNLNLLGIFYIPVFLVGWIGNHLVDICVLSVARYTLMCHLRVSRVSSFREAAGYEVLFDLREHYLNIPFHFPPSGHEARAIVPSTRCWYVVVVWADLTQGVECPACERVSRSI